MAKSLSGITRVGPLYIRKLLLNNLFLVALPEKQVQLLCLPGAVVLFIPAQQAGARFAVRPERIQVVSRVACSILQLVQADPAFVFQHFEFVPACFVHLFQCKVFAKILRSNVFLIMRLPGFYQFPLSYFPYVFPGKKMLFSSILLT